VSITHPAGLTEAGPSVRSLPVILSKIIGFALLIAVGARLQVPMPGSPVPVTLQTLAVLVAGGLLGPWGGVSSVAAYLCLGVAGAPVFARGGGPAYLLGPTGGYLLGFLPGVWIAGMAAVRLDRRWKIFLGFFAATLVVHLAGWAQLSVQIGPLPALEAGVRPFLAWDALKALLAAGLVLRLRGGSRPEEGRPEGFAQ